MYEKNSIMNLILLSKMDTTGKSIYLDIIKTNTERQQSYSIYILVNWIEFYEMETKIKDYWENFFLMTIFPEKKKA